MLSIDDVHIEKDLGLHLLQDSDETALPQVRNNSVTIPGRHGAIAFDSYFEPRQFFEQILIPTQATINDVQAIVRKVSTLLLDEYGKPKEVKLKFDYEPDKYYKAKFSGFISINRIANAGIFPIPFLAYDPFAYSMVENHEINWDSETVTFDDFYSMDTVFIDEVQITKEITLETFVHGYNVKPTILISGSGNNVTFQSNGKSFSLKNFTDSTFEIDGNKYTVIKNGQNGFNQKVGNDFLELKPGLNKIKITGSNLDFKLSVKLRDQFM